MISVFILLACGGSIGSNEEAGEPCPCGVPRDGNGVPAYDPTDEWFLGNDKVLSASHSAMLLLIFISVPSKPGPELSI
jgi:hypothetical protein